MTDPIDNAQSWEDQHDARERERMRLKDARLRAVGRFVRVCVRTVAIVGSIGTVIAGCVFWHLSCKAEKAAEIAAGKSEEQLKERLELLYDQERIACINAHGREQCEMWFEVGMHTCRLNRGSIDTWECIRGHEERRMEKLAGE